MVRKSTRGGSVFQLLYQFCLCGTWHILGMVVEITDVIVVLFQLSPLVSRHISFDASGWLSCKNPEEVWISSGVSYMGI